MISAQRHHKILTLLREKSPASVSELAEALQASEATIRRDINVLDKKNLLIKVYGGAMTSENYLMSEDNVALRENVNIEAKISIAAKAASLIKKRGMVYIDAGTTTAFLISRLQERNVVYVTNAPAHAVNLIKLGFKTVIIGGRLKGLTYAAVGALAVAELQRYNFTTGFFGTNGIGINSGFTTPTTEEAAVKETAIQRCKRAFVLADDSKFGKIAPISFAKLNAATIITNKEPHMVYSKYDILVTK